MCNTKSPLRVLALLLLASPALAQWSGDAGTNISVGDGTGDQVQAKMAVTADGGAFVSWFDSIANGFDVRVQKLDAGGNELMAHNGALVADRGFSSTQDYGLDVDASGNALLAFRDDGGVGTQISAAKVSPAGVLLWGASNVQLTSTTDFVAAPRIAGTSDGGAIVAWTQGSSVHLQKLDSGGTVVWGADVVLTPGAGSYSASDLHDSGAGAILSFVHQTGSFGSPRHILAQKFDASGAPQWGAGHVAVFDGGSLQIGNFPSFLPDGSGGALFSWYETSPLQCRAQHILSGGSEAFPHNGSVASTNASRLRVEPSLTYDSASNQVILFWLELNSTQSMFGLRGQRFDSSGSRLWGSEGSVILPLSSTPLGLIRGQNAGSGAFVFWSQGGFGSEQLHGTRLGVGGVVDLATFDVSSPLSSKARLAAGLGATGQVILAWRDERVDAGDILAQNVNPDGTLGVLPAAVPVLPRWGLWLLGLGFALLGTRLLRWSSST